MNDLHVKLIKHGFGYMVVIESNAFTRTWGFNDIDSVRLWHKILGEVIEKYESIM